MRKNLLVMGFCLVWLPVLAQIQVISETKIEVPVVEKIYSFWWGNGQILNENGSYILYGPTNYRYSDARHTLYLGDSKESAIKSLEDIEQMRNTLDAEWLVAQPDGKPVRIYHYDGFFLFSKEGVPGYSSVLHYLKTEKAIQKIGK